MMDCGLEDGQIPQDSGSQRLRLKHDLKLRGGILMSIGNSPEISSRRILVGIILVGRLGCSQIRVGGTRLAGAVLRAREHLYIHIHTYAYVYVYVSHNNYVYVYVDVLYLSLALSLSIPAPRHAGIRARAVHREVRIIKTT